MIERPILFSAPMVRALLDGSKSQTRRAVKLDLAGRVGRSGRSWHVEDPAVTSACPYGQPGDRLWVRECFAAWWDTATGKRSKVMGYRADIDDPDWDGGFADDPWWLGAKWEPSIHMPRAFSRITLEVTRVRVERLQSISYADIVAEGVTVPACVDSGNALIDISTKDGPGAFLTREQYKDPEAIVRAHWAALWCQVNGRASWEANPWVWVVEFKRAE